MRSRLKWASRTGDSCGNEGMEIHGNRELRRAAPADYAASARGPSGRKLAAMQHTTSGRRAMRGRVVTRGTGRLARLAPVVFILQALIGAPSVLAAVSLSADLVPNGDFETGSPPESWAPALEVTAARDTSSPHGGVASLALSHSIASNKAGSVRSGGFTLSAGTIYDFSFWYRVPAGANVDEVIGTVLLFSDVSCSTLYRPAPAATTITADGLWYQATRAFTAPAEAACAKVLLATGRASGGDGSGTPLTVYFDDVVVRLRNDAPVVATTSGSLAYTENDAATFIDSGLTVTDADSTQLMGATVAITSSFTSGQDALVFGISGSIAGSYDTGAGVLTLSGSDTVANYQAALRSVKY